MTRTSHGPGRWMAAALILTLAAQSTTAQSTGVIGAPFEDVVGCDAWSHGLLEFDFSNEPNTGAACTTLPWTPKATLSVPGAYEVAERLLGQTKLAEGCGPAGNHDFVDAPASLGQAPQIQIPTGPEFGDSLFLVRDNNPPAGVLPDQIQPSAIWVQQQNTPCHANNLGEGAFSVSFELDQTSVGLDLLWATPRSSVGTPATVCSSVNWDTSPATGGTLKFDFYDRAGLRIDSVYYTPVQAHSCLIFKTSGAGIAGMTVNNIDAGGIGFSRLLLSCACVAPVSYCTSSTTRTAACVPVISSTGVPSATAGTGFMLNGTELLNARQGTLIYGVNGAREPALPFGGGGGLLCFRGPVRHLPVTRTGGSPKLSPDCTGSLSYDFNAHIASGLDPALGPCTTVWAQFIFRDPPSVALSDALQFTICP